LEFRAGGATQLVRVAQQLASVRPGVQTPVPKKKIKLGIYIKLDTPTFY
jgi:hypothetical protein